MNEKFLKPYDHTQTEDSVYTRWETSGLFNPDECIKQGYTKEDAPSFSIVLPPPNVTGTLHTGHALMLVIEDIMVRYHRMKGHRTLWLPGTDHAAIATQSKVEGILSKQGIRRHEIGREAFLTHVHAFAQESHDTIVGQVKKMGSSVDWSREAFTLDEKREIAVRTAFKKMYDDGLIYQGERIVNWDPKGQTTISDDEIVYQEEETTLYYLQYGPFTIATARPETKFGDKYVVMHPDDSRYSSYTHGHTIELEWINGPITATIIKDSVIDMEFGTGVMTITPWHSTADFEIAERHNLDKEQIIDHYGKLLPIAGDFAGKKISEARKEIIEKLRSKGLVVKEEEYTHNIATAERTGGVIEPQIMRQWWVSVSKPFTLNHSTIAGIPSGSTTTLKDILIHTVRSKQIDIVPDRFEKTYFHWIENLRDWCISRQIWYGHRIPVWYRTINGTEEKHVGISAPEGDMWQQDSDTLDTWFSSGLWTFSTLGWPDATDDFKTYHPTHVLETGYDILFFWVARMILMSGYLLGSIPFSTVYLHGLVRDAKGRKMSKSLGNIIDPLDLIKTHGADALRMGLIVGNGPGNDVNLSEDKIKAYRKFSNKLWNITRFVLENTQDYKTHIHDETLDHPHLTTLADTLRDITEDIESFRYYLASEKLYHYIWHTFADIIIEESKSLLSGTPEQRLHIQRVLVSILLTTLKALHPFMPFITEEIWSELPWRAKSLLMIEPWPSR